MGVNIVRYTGSTCPEIGRLEWLANSEGHDFVTRAMREWHRGDNRFDRPGECFHLAQSHDGEVTIGVCGVNVDPYTADPSVGRLRHLYVDPEHRRTGLAHSLVKACLDAASGPFARLRLRTSNPAAAALYESMGFDAVTESDATHSIRLPTIG